MVSVVIPIFAQDKVEELKVDVPLITQNLFERIIRDPTNPDRPARETQCSEMLCALLLNCETLKLQFFEQFAAMFGWPNVSLAELDYDIETEQAIGSKRDDLRIEGFRVREDKREPVLLWTIEVKVQAGIHDSSYEEYGESSDPLEEEQFVPQIENYDRWLASQDAPHKGGIVLAIPNLQREVDELKTSSQWCCLRWTDLGIWVESAIENDSLPERERTLAEHFLGFVWNRLRDPFEMSKNKLGIDDLALMRAFATHGLECERKVNALVQPMMEAMSHSGISFSNAPKPQTTLFKTYKRSAAFAYLIPEDACKPFHYLSLMVGIHHEDAFVLIESNKTCPWKPRIKRICQEAEAALRERNPDWQFLDTSGWNDLTLRKGLAWLLIEEDQAAALRTFVQAAIEDLKATGVINALQAIPREQSP